MTVKHLRHFLNIKIKSNAIYDQKKDRAAANNGFAKKGVCPKKCVWKTKKVFNLEHVEEFNLAIFPIG